MPFSIIRQDVTVMNVDAVVNPTDVFLSGSGGVDKRIRFAAGRKLEKACAAVGGCDVGEAIITEGFNLPATYIIHTVGPVWQGGNNDEEALLASCYRRSLKLATEYNCRTVAVPLISSGTFGYPKDLALHIAVSTISEFLLTHDLTVYLVVYDKDSFGISERLFSDITSYIDDTYVEERQTRSCFASAPMPCAAKRAVFEEDAATPDDLDEWIKKLDESFSECLLRLIDEKGLTDAQVYHKANIDRKLFSKIRSNPHYRPSKATVLAFAVALELSLDETESLLKKAGFALSNSNKFDVIIEFFIRRGQYDIFVINEALFAFDQNLLGG